MTTPTPETSEVTATEPTEPEAKPEAKPTDTVEFWKGKAREQEKRAKDNATAASELQKIKDAQKSDEERRSEALSAAERRASDAEMRATRLDVAFEKGLTPAQAKRLSGSTREELEADAEEVLRDFPVRPTTPSGDIGQGPRATNAAAGPAQEFAALIQKQMGVRT